MSETVLAIDLGTGGCKASIWSADAHCLAENFSEYPTFHPAPGRNEQRPADWWEAVTISVSRLVATASGAAATLAGISLSGQSLGVIMLDAEGDLIEEATPIWSDARAEKQSGDFFERIPEACWYRRTGNGFPAALYPLFKAAWFREHAPGSWARTRTLVGCKDYINYRLTGVIATDHSYASGTGAYDLLARNYDPELLGIANIESGLFPEPRESTEVIGTLTGAAASRLGIASGIPVFAGGVDNACMALGSLGTVPGRVYASLGSSSWITVTGDTPLLDLTLRPYVFAHAVPRLFISALSTFSSGTSIMWLRDLLAPHTTIDAFATEACTAPLGAKGITLLPMLAGGTAIEGGPSARGAVMGLDLRTTRADIARAGLEGIAFAFRRSIDAMRTLGDFEAELLITGGGVRHDGWNHIYADVLNTSLVRTAVGQQAAALGAAAIAFVGLGLWGDFTRAESPHVVTNRYEPNAANSATYELLRCHFEDAVNTLAQLKKRVTPA